MKTSNLDVVGVILSHTTKVIEYYYMKSLSRVYIGFQLSSGAAGIRFSIFDLTSATP